MQSIPVDIKVPIHKLSITDNHTQSDKTQQIKKSKWIGSSRWPDYKSFDDKIFLQDLLDYKISKIKIWYGHGFSPKPPDINGIQFTFKHITSGKLKPTEERMGQRSMDGFKEFELSDNEYIVDVKIRSGWIVDCLVFVLNTGRKIEVGGTGGSAGYYELDKNDVVVGTYGSYGTNLYQFGLYTITRNDLLLHRFRIRRLPFLAVRMNYAKNIEKLNEIIELLVKNNNNNYAKEIAFGKLCLLPKSLFANVISYL